MGIFDWLRFGQHTAEEPPGMSRRDFFARMAGRESGPAAPMAAADGDPVVSTDDPDPDTGARVIHTFHLANFPYYDGPVLVPILRAGDEYHIGVDPPYSRNPRGLRIERGRECLGTVPDDVFPDLLRRMRAGETIICRALEVNPAAELAKVLTVQILSVPPEEENPEVHQDEAEPGPDAGTDAENEPESKAPEGGAAGNGFSAPG